MFTEAIKKATKQNNKHCHPIKYVSSQGLTKKRKETEIVLLVSSADSKAMPKTRKKSFVCNYLVYRYFHQNFLFDSDKVVGAFSFVTNCQGDSVVQFLWDLVMWKIWWMWMKGKLLKALLIPPFRNTLVTSRRDGSTNFLLVGVFEFWMDSKGLSCYLECLWNV